MNEQQKQLIKDLYKKGGYEQKQLIKEAFPEMFMQEETIHLFGNMYKISLIN
jgi:hypothetical protein